MALHLDILRTCILRARRPLVRDDQRTWSGLHLLGGAFHTADLIASNGSSPTVGILLPTSGAFPMALLGTWILGRTAVPLNYLLARDELEFVVRDSGIDLILTAGPMLDFLGYEPAGAKVVRLDRQAFRGVPSPRWPKRTGEDELAALLYTSGTSGKPKGVMLTGANLHANVRQVYSHVHFTPADSLFGVLPQFHAFGFTVLTLLPLVYGLQTTYAARFVPARIVQTLRERRPTVFVGIPSMFAALVRLKNASADDFASLRYIISGGEPLPRDVAERFLKRFGKPICEGYGLTETSPVTHVCLPEGYRPGTVGMGVPHLRTRIVDYQRERDVPPGVQGEIRMAGPNVFSGYYHRPKETAEAFDDRGFFRTGDIGMVDRDGYLSITGRLKEMLIVGGENVFPREIEEVLNSHESIAASGVVGQIDPVRGEVPVAFVEVAEGADFDETSLREHCRRSLAGYKVPREIYVIEELPRSPTGKILRRSLRERLGATT